MKLTFDEKKLLYTYGCADLELTRKQQQSTKHSYRKTGNAAANMPKIKSWLNRSLLIQSPFN